MREQPTRPVEMPRDGSRVAMRVAVGVAVILLSLWDLRGGSTSGNEALIVVAGLGILVGAAYAVGSNWGRVAMGVMLFLVAGLIALAQSWGLLTITLLLFAGWWYATPPPKR